MLRAENGTRSARGKTRCRHVALAVAPMLAVACYEGSGGDGGGGDGTQPPDTPACADGVQPSPSPRVVRLTHTQYDNTIRDLLAIEIGSSASFIDDPQFAGFDNNAEALAVNDRLARDYQRAAEELAAMVVADPGPYDALVPCDPEADAEGCARTFVSAFLRRAFRRPPTDAERDQYLELWRTGPGLYDEGSTFAQGVRLVVEGALQSPNFLYRLELSDAVDAQGLVPLGGYELASRLSYMLWNSMPDEALLAAAEDGSLVDPTVLEDHARRLIADSRALDPIRDFHQQWLHMSRYDDLIKDPEQYPRFDPNFAQSMVSETQRFIEHVIFELDGDVRTLFTEPVTFVNQDVASMYGLDETYGGEFERIELDPTQRGGLLTQAGFLASHAYFDTSSPIHRGVFVQRQVLCADLPDPPANIDTELPPLEGEIETTRDQVEAHTAPPQCAACHNLINEPGFALETYDAVGAWRTEDNGFPIDASGEVVTPSGSFPFDGPIDFVTKLAENPDTQRCYLTQWFRYAYAREESADDACTLDALDETLVATDYNIQELMVALTQTLTFRHRKAEVAP